MILFALLGKNVFERHKKYTDFLRTSTLIYTCSGHVLSLGMIQYTFTVISTLGLGKSSYQQPRQPKWQSCKQEHWKACQPAWPSHVSHDIVQQSSNAVLKTKSKNRRWSKELATAHIVSAVGVKLLLCTKSTSCRLGETFSEQYLAKARTPSLHPMCT